MFRFGDPGGRAYGTTGTAGANILQLWTSGTSTSNVAVSAGNGRVTGSCLRWTNFNSYLDKALDSQQTWGVAFAYKTGGMPISNAQTLCSFVETSTSQVDLRMNPDGSLAVTRNGTVLGTTPGTYGVANVWIHYEFKAKIDPSVGTYQVWVNGVSRLSGTNANTRATSNSSASIIRIGPMANTAMTGTATWDYDDVIVYDGQATDPNGNADIVGPIGDCNLTWVLPNGAGTTTQLTRGGTDSGANWSQLNDTTPNGDTNYVESSTVGNLDTYNIADLPGNTAVVKSVAILGYAEKTDSGSRQTSGVVRTGGTNFVHASPTELSNGYTYSFYNWGTNPSTVAAWTVTDVNGLEIGQKVTN